MHNALIIAEHGIHIMASTWLIFSKYPFSVVERLECLVEI